jgi:glycosyltransferase involved in cell wall biosynthesis
MPEHETRPFTPLVSVVIPAYNAERTLGETVASVLSQSFTDFEALVVDDGSSDATAEVALASADSRLRVLKTANGGVSRARNTGIAAAKGELIAFLDSDDIWEPDKLERQVAALGASPSAGFCVTAAIRIDEHSQVTEPIPLVRAPDVCRTLLLHSMAVGCVSSGMARKSVLESIGGFDPRFSQCADWDLWLRVSANTEFLVLDDQLVRYRTSPGNMSSNIRLLERDTFAVLDSFFATGAATPYRHDRRRAYSEHWLVCAGSYLHTGQIADAIRCLARAAGVRPVSLTRALGMPWRQLKRLSKSPRPTQ